MVWEYLWNYNESHCQIGDLQNVRDKVSKQYKATKQLPFRAFPDRSLCVPTKATLRENKINNSFNTPVKMPTSSVEFTILKLAFYFICGLSLVGPLIIQVNLTGNIGVIAKTIFWGTLLSRHILKVDVLTVAEVVCIKLYIKICLKQNMMYFKKLLMHETYEIMKIVTVYP